MSIIPVNLNEVEAGPLPGAVYSLQVTSVKNLNAEGAEAGPEELPATIQLNVKVVGDMEGLEKCRTMFQHRLNLPNSSDEASMRDFKRKLIKDSCEGFDIAHSEEGFDPQDFVGQIADRVLVVQTVAKNGAIYNNIKSFMD